MCDPLTAAVVASTVLSIATATASFVGQNEQAKNAKTIANLNYARESDAVGAQSRQQDQAQSENVFDTALAGIQAQGDITASASDQGLAPTSIAHSINASMFGLGRNASLEEKNANNRRLQLGTDLEGAGISRQASIAEHPKGSLITLGLQSASAIASGAGTLAKAGKFDPPKKAG